MANGRSQRVDSRRRPSAAEGEFTRFELPLQPFVDGGWYWFDVVAGDEDAVVESAEWTAEVPARPRRRTARSTIGITTMNRPDFCAKLLGQLGDDDAAARPTSTRCSSIEQGTRKVVDYPSSSAGRRRRSATSSGSSSRATSAAPAASPGRSTRRRKAGRATTCCCSTTTSSCEPEGIIRAVTFGDLAASRRIVGGHMFSLFSRSRLHSFGEMVEPYRFWWRSAPDVHHRLGPRRPQPALAPAGCTARVDVDFNGWFMCLIPRQVLDEIGLSLPLFIKWDDAEFGLRAKEAGYPTVTFPGAAVWHVPWTDKNDALDWQAYFHQRNRFVAALLHSPYPRGGRLVRESLNHQIKHLVSMQYSTVELRHQALEDVLAGPEQLHATCRPSSPRSTR